MKKAGIRKLDPQRRADRVVAEPALVPGLHAATIELASKGTYRVRLVTGEHVRARLAPGVDPTLATECLKQRRTVLVSGHPKGPVIVGALQVTASERPEKLRLEAKDIELCAEGTIAFRVGKSVVIVDEHGAVQMLGERMTLRMAKAIRVLSANVELP